MNRALPLRVAALLGLAAVACAGPTFVVQRYDGDVRPPESIAILRMNGADEVRPVTLDDVDIIANIPQDSRLHIEVLPGRHTLDARNGTAAAVTLAFQAEAGKVYRVLIPAGGATRVYEVDRGSDQPTRDVTLPPAR